MKKLNDEQKQLIIKNLKLADKIAQSTKKTYYFISYDELQSAAYMGLSEAALNFNIQKCASFSNYATYRIFGAIKDYLRELRFGTKSIKIKLCDSIL